MDRCCFCDLEGTKSGFLKVRAGNGIEMPLCMSCAKMGVVRGIQNVIHRLKKELSEQKRQTDKSSADAPGDTNTAAEGTTQSS